MNIHPNVCKKGLLLLIITIVLCTGIYILLVFNLDIVVPEESELLKYPELRIFMSDYKDFQGIAHNLDTGHYSFSFSISHRSLQDYFALAEENSKSFGWRLVFSDSFKQVYERESHRYPADEGLEHVTLSYDESSKRIIFLREPFYGE